MKGVEKDLLEISVKALRKAYEEIGDLRVDYAAEKVGAGKFDTYGLDSIPEEVIKHEVSGYDSNIVLVTEETGKMYHGERGLEPTQSVLICDPTDRSIKMREFLRGLMKKYPDYSKKYVHEIFDNDVDFWKKGIDISVEGKGSKKIHLGLGPGSPSVTGASSSITAIKDRRILFNVMVNYVTGELFVADSLGTTKCLISDYGKCDNMKTVKFSSDKRQGGKFVTFLEKSGYPENLEKCNLGLDPKNCIDTWSGGPLRILRMSDIDDQNVSFILSNGEKVCEWIGWLAWVKHAKDPVQSDEHAMEAYRLFFESPRTKELVLVAPAPHYSIFTAEDGKTKVNLERMFQLKDPSHYRETILITSRHNVGEISRVRSLGKYYEEMIF